MDAIFRAPIEDKKQLYKVGSPRLAALGGGRARGKDGRLRPPLACHAGFPFDKYLVVPTHMPICTHSASSLPSMMLSPRSRARRC